MNTSKNKIKSLMLVLFFSAATISTASARVCFLPDSTDCGEGDVVGSGNVDVPCQYSSCPAYNSNYQECYDERTYNNAGVNVTCKQIRCKLSKSKCEELEDDPNSSQCCNFDSASGCYYMGSCKLCNRDVFDSEKNLGEGYNCYPCKDKNGTFYNCTAIEKECKDINPKYTSSCSDSQTAEEVKGVKDSNNNQCYTCKDKPLEIVKPVITITYKETYNSLTPSAGADPEEYYYQTLKFTATSSDNISRTILMKTYPAITCSKPQYTTGSPVTINERTETIIGSRCGTQSRVLPVSSVAALDTFINGTKVYSFEPYYSSHSVFDGLDGTTVETNDYTVKFVKEGKCKYTYAHLTTSDTDASTNFNGSSALYSNFQSHRGNTPSAYYYYIGGENYYHAYNKISKNSNTCYNENNQLRYETICSGFIKRNCNTEEGKIFTPTCTSDEYNVAGLKIEGMEFGTCSCDTSKEEFDTKELCNSKTSKNCSKLSSNGCYATCSKVGLYDSEKECLDSAGQISVTCTKVDDCYKKELKGFLIRYAHGELRNWRCELPHNGTVATETHAWLAEIQPNVSYPGPILKTVEGVQHQDLPDNRRDATETYQYPAGTYYVCANFIIREQIGTTRGYAVSLSKVGISYARDLVGSDTTQTKCFANDISYQYNNVGCEKRDYSGGNYICHKFTFEKGKLYLISFGYYKDSNYYTGGRCNNN